MNLIEIQMTFKIGKEITPAVRQIVSQSICLKY